MYLFFYGEDIFRIKEKIDQIIDKYLKKDPSGMNLATMAGEDLTYDKYQAAISAMPFLADKRLVIVKNLLLDCKREDVAEKIAQTLSSIPETTVVIFAEYGKPDKRKRVFKALNQKKVSQEFESLSGYDLRKKIRSFYASLEVKADEEAFEKIVLALGSDLWRHKAESEKLALYAKSQERREVFPSDVDMLVRSESEADIFEFIEKIAKKDASEAFYMLKQFIDQGENENYLLSMIVYQYRSMIMVADLLDREVEERMIAKEAGLHPYVVKKTIPLVRKYSTDTLISIFAMLQRFDANIKVGQIEAREALDLVVAKLSGS